MALSPITLNGISAIGARLTFPYRGVWCAEVELSSFEVDSAAIQALATSGAPAALVCGGATLTGRVDSTHSGTFSSKATIRLVGGRGGWSKVLSPQHFFGPGGTLLS